MKYSYSLSLLPLLFSSSLFPSVAADDSVPLLSIAEPAAIDPSSASVLVRLGTALRTWQDTFFSHTRLTWPTGIDWTNAFHGTLLSSLLPYFPEYLNDLLLFFRGQDVVSLRDQAHDDMLWVVLNWIEAIEAVKEIAPNSGYISMFEDRALEFYNLAAQGWDEQLCGGGMIWSPHLEPYKNAITNELWIAASIRMYQVASTRNVQHLISAMGGYQWLKSSGMLNANGLYADGFHVSNLTTGGTTCDKLDKMVYTYNQGVLLTGLRGLYEELGDPQYLKDGTALVDATIRADSELIREGVLTEKCDPGGYCSQNGQTFKAIWMHHLSYFCALPEVSAECERYGVFVRQNAEAAWNTRNGTGVGGMWWGSPVGQRVGRDEVELELQVEQGEKLEDGENDCVGEEWAVCEKRQRRVGWREGDSNDRGRGRTVESHAGLVAALRAALEVGAVET